MRCAESEELFESALEGTLTVRGRSDLDAHLDTCPHCAGIFEELRVVDALLLQPRSLDPAPNFTFKAMAEIRTMPAPAAARPVWPWMFSVYLIVSWIAIGAWIASARPEAHAALTATLAFVGHFFAALDGIARVAGSGFGLGYATVGSIVAFLLGIDAVLLVGVVGIRRYVRPRLAAHLARSDAA